MILKKARTNIHIDPEIKKEFWEHCEKEGFGKSKRIELILKQYLNKQKKLKKQN